MKIGEINCERCGYTIVWVDIDEPIPDDIKELMEYPVCKGCKKKEQSCIS